MSSLLGKRRQFLPSQDLACWQSPLKENFQLEVNQTVVKQSNYVSNLKQLLFSGSFSKENVFFLFTLLVQDLCQINRALISNLR